MFTSLATSSEKKGCNLIQNVTPSLLSLGNMNAHHFIPMWRGPRTDFRGTALVVAFQEDDLVNLNDGSTTFSTGTLQLMSQR